MTAATGYVFFALLAALFLGITGYSYRRFKVQSVDELVAGGRRTSLGIISASIAASWVWTLTIFGASEAGLWFGMSGGFHYAWGAVIPFLVFMPIALRLRRIMPKVTTFTEFIYERYGPATHLLFFVAGVGVALYVFTQQMLGAGVLFSTIFGIPFRVGVILTAALVISYITLAGLRSSLLTDVVQFLVIGLAAVFALPAVLAALGGAAGIYEGLTEVATNPQHHEHNPDALNFFSTAGIRYGIAAVVIAMGQVLFEQGYYQRAVAAASQQTLKRAYLIGGVLAWFPIPLAFGTVLGTGGLATLGEGELASTSEVAPYLMSTLLGTGGLLIFAAMIFMAACSTADTSLAGVQSLFTADLFDRYFRKNRIGERAQLRFGRVVTAAFGIGCALLALSLEGVSLLTIDIFSGILFAAPCSALIAGIFWRKPSSRVVIPATLSGLVVALIAYFAIPDPDINWFVANVIALFLPALLIVTLSPVFPTAYRFERLASWSPAHQTDVTADVPTENEGVV